MTPDDLKKELEAQIAALAQEREQSARNELAVQNHLEQAKANTAFVAGQLKQAKMLLEILKEAK